MNNPTPPAAASDAAIAQAFREIDQCDNHSAEECAAFNRVFNRAREIDGLHEKVHRFSRDLISPTAQQATPKITDAMVERAMRTRTRLPMQPYREHMRTILEEYEAARIQSAQPSGVAVPSFDSWFATGYPHVNQIANEGDDDSRANRAFAREAWCAALNLYAPPIAQQGSVEVTDADAELAMRVYTRVRDDLLAKDELTVGQIQREAWKAALASKADGETK
jgi:hypothetical protein